MIKQPTRHDIRSIQREYPAETTPSAALYLMYRMPSDSLEAFIIDALIHKEINSRYVVCKKGTGKT